MMNMECAILVVAFFYLFPLFSSAQNEIDSNLTLKKSHTILQFTPKKSSTEMLGKKRLLSDLLNSIQSNRIKNHNEIITFDQNGPSTRSDSITNLSAEISNKSRMFQEAANPGKSYVDQILADTGKENKHDLSDKTFDYLRGNVGQRPNLKESYFSQEDDSDDSNYEYRCQISTETIDFDTWFMKSGSGNHRRDMFNCSTRCLCKYLDYNTKHVHVSADCVKKGLHAIPQDLPLSILRLDISDNRITDMNLANVHMYTSLKELHATDCYILNISNTITGTSQSLETLDLRYNYIRSLPLGVFSRLKKLQILLLTGNLIQHVHQDFFTGLYRLHFLDLSLNNIQSIESTSFRDLTDLKMLSLSGNHNLNYDTFTPDLFKNLKRLKSLKIQGSSSRSTKYPNEAIAMLQELEDLNIDALAGPAEFGQQFESLKHLKILRFGPYANCRLDKMPSSFFQYFPNLICLYFHSCNISHLNSEAYGSFKKLEALTIEKIPSMTLDEAFSHLNGFKTKSLKYIGFKNLTNWKWPCIWMTSKEGKPMVGFNLTTINLSENRLSLLSDSFISVIPPTVEKLILRKNKFTLINTFWTSLHNLNQLSYIDVSIQNMENRNLYFPFDIERGHTRSFRDLHRARSEKESNAISAYMKHTLEKRSTRQRDDMNNMSVQENVVLQVPVNLNTVKASEYNFFGGVLLSHAVGNNSLKSLNFSRSGLHHWGDGKLPKHVEIFDVSINAATFINPEFFHPNNSLIQLHLQVNFLGEFIGGANGSLFRYLKNLKYLDLTTNVLFVIPYDLFTELNNIETIVMADNRLEYLDVDLENTQHLKFLDLHRNSLTWISETTRNHLDKIHGITVDLHYNHLLCICDNIDMMVWMATTNVYFLNMHLYTCYDENKKLVMITTRQEMKIRADYLKRHCASYGYLLFGILACGLIFTITTIAGISYRYRWWIRYKKHVLFARWFGFKPHGGREHEESHYKYDAFLIYVSGDQFLARLCQAELEKERGHKLFIGDRDILPGTMEIGAIVSAVQNSRITLILISSNFVKEMDDYFTKCPMVNYAIQMAIQEEYCTKRKTLHIMEFTNNCQHIKYPPNILKIFRDGCVTHLPSIKDAGVTNHVITTSWDSLSAAIGHTAARCLHVQGDGDDDNQELCIHAYNYNG